MTQMLTIKAVNITPMTRAQRRSLEKVAKSLVEVCVRNAVEDLHSYPMTMPHEIKEADWKVLRRLHPLALERFSERVRRASES